MKTTKTRLDVDQIGGNGTLTAADVKKISRYILDQKKNLSPLKKTAHLSKTKNP